ncbi:Motility protein B [Rhodocyclaceae bacterium]|nr:Motility protein B [Rhodocyclaceae bacterium]
MASNDKRPIVVKRIKKVAAGNHGGAWKIAYADFVTAMMAFFLLMWLLGNIAKEDLAGIADYFKTPLFVSMSGGSSNSESSSMIKGGGTDVTRNKGEVRKGDIRPEKKIQLKTSTEEMTRLQKQQELDRLRVLKASLEKAIDASQQLQQFKKQILLDITSEGLRIQIVDEKNRPMFQTGSARLEPYTKEILHEIGVVLNEVPNKISLSGHTDAQQYFFGEKGYSNWELSADRANASRRELIAGGMGDDKIVRVVGLSSAVLFDKSDPLNPINRRISIIVMNKKAEEAARNDGGTVDVKNDDGQGAQQKISDGVATLPPAAKH